MQPWVFMCTIKPQKPGVRVNASVTIYGSVSPFLYSTIYYDKAAPKGARKRFHERLSGRLLFGLAAGSPIFLLFHYIGMLGQQRCALQAGAFV